MKHIMTKLSVYAPFVLGFCCFILAHGWPEPAYTFVAEDLLRISAGIDKYGWPPFMIQAGVLLLWVLLYNFLVLATTSEKGDAAFWDHFAGSFRKFQLFVYAIIIGLPALILFDSIFQIVIVFIPPLYETLAWPDTLEGTIWFEAYFELLILSAFFIFNGVAQLALLDEIKKKAE